MASVTNACSVLPSDGPQSYDCAYEELKVMIFFSGLPFDSLRAEFEDEDICVEMGFSATKLFNTMAWVDGHPGKLGPEPQDKVIFVDASDVVFGDLDGIEEDKNEWLTAVAFGVEVFREYITKKIFQNIKGHVTVLLCAYSPAEPLMFAMSDIFLHFMDDEGLYTSFRTLSSSKYLNTFADLETHGWSFDVSHCCIFEGYELIMQKIGLDDRIKEAEMLFEMLHGQNISYMAKQVKDAGKEIPEYVQPTVDATHLYTPEEWNNMGYSFKSYSDTNGNEVVDEFKITFEDEQYTEKELGVKINVLKQEKKDAEEKAQDEWDDKSWDEQQQDIINRGKYLKDQEDARWERLQPELDEIDRLIKESDQKQFKYDNNPDYQVEHMIWDSQTNNGENRDNFNFGGRRYGDVPFKGRWTSNWQLRELRAKYQKEHDAKVKEAEETLREGEIYKKRKWIAVGHIVLAVGSIFFSPLSLLDIALEVYEVDVTGEDIIHTMHEANIVLDFVGLIPVVGGGIKLGKLLKTGQAIGNAAKLAGKELIKKGATALIKDGDDVLKAIAKEVPDDVLEARKFVEGAKAPGKLSDDAARELTEIEQTATNLDKAEKAATEGEKMKSSVEIANKNKREYRGKADNKNEELKKAREKSKEARISADNAKIDADQAQTKATKARKDADNADIEAGIAKKNATEARTKADNAKNNIPKETPSAEELTQWKNSQGNEKFSKPNKRKEKKWRKQYNRERSKKVEEAKKYDNEATRLEGEFKAAEEKAGDLKTKAKQLETEAETAKGEYETLNREATKLEEKKGTLEGEASQLEKAAQKAKEEAEDMEREMKELQEEGEKVQGLRTQLQEKMDKFSQQLAEDFYKKSSMPVNSASSILDNLWQQSHLVSYRNAFSNAYKAVGGGIKGAGWGALNVIGSFLKDVFFSMPLFGSKGDIETGMKLFDNKIAARALMLAQNIVVKPYWTYGQISNVGFIWYNTDFTPLDYLKSNFNSENFMESNTKNPNEVPSLKSEYSYSPYEELPDQSNGQLLQSIHDRGMENAYNQPEEPAAYYSGDSNEIDREAIEKEQKDNWVKDGMPVYPSFAPNECGEGDNDVLEYTDETGGYTDDTLLPMTQDDNFAPSCMDYSNIPESSPEGADFELSEDMDFPSSTDYSDFQLGDSEAHLPQGADVPDLPADIDGVDIPANTDIEWDGIKMKNNKKYPFTTNDFKLN